MSRVEVIRSEHPRLMRHVVLAFLIAIAAMLTACGSRGSVTPQETTRSFARAIQAGDYERAHGFLSDELRAKFSVEDIEQLTEGEVPVLSVDALQRLAVSPAALRADAILGSYHDVTWVYADGAWLLAGGEFWAPDLSSPYAALRTFIQGVDTRNWEAVRSTAPSELRDSLSDETLEAWIASEPESVAVLRAILQNFDAMPVRVSETRAWLRYADKQVTFQTEGSRWYIDTFE